MKNNPVIGAVILAAGESKRLGTPKQLIQCKDKTLLHHIIESALNSKCRKIIVVIGAHADNVKKYIAKFSIDIIERQTAATKWNCRSGEQTENSSPKEKLLRCNSTEWPGPQPNGATAPKPQIKFCKRNRVSQIYCVENRNWREGKASSIRVGLKALTSKSNNVNAAIFLTCDQPFISSDVIDRIIETYEKTKKTIVASKYDDTIGVPALFGRKHFSEILSLKGDQGAKSIITNYHEQVVTISFQKGAIDIDTIEDLNQLKLNK